MGLLFGRHAGTRAGGPMPIRKLHDFEVTRVAAHVPCKRETVRKYLAHPERMQPAKRASVEASLRALGYLDDRPAIEPGRAS